MEKFYFDLFGSLIAIAAFYFLYKYYMTERLLVKESEISLLLDEYPLSRRDFYLDAKLFKIINELRTKNIKSISIQLSAYLIVFSFDYLQLEESYKLINNNIKSKKKQLLLKKILTEALASLPESALASVYVSGLEKNYSKEFSKEKNKLFDLCLCDKNKNLFFENVYRKIDELMESADKSVDERLLLFTEKIKAYYKFAI